MNISDCNILIVRRHLTRLNVRKTNLFF